MIAQRLCSFCLNVGHSSKNCRSNRTCRICHLSHHTALCHKSNHNSSNSQVNGPSFYSSSYSNDSHTPQHLQSYQPHPLQNHNQQHRPVVAPNRSKTQRSPEAFSVQSHATHVKSFATQTNNMLSTVTLDLRYFGDRMNTRAIFDTDSQRSFVSPKVFQQLNLQVTDQILVHLSTFGNDTELMVMDLVKVKVQFGGKHIPIKLLVHETASMDYLNCPWIFNVAQRLSDWGYQLADRGVNSDILIGVEILIGVDYFSQFVKRQRKAQAVNLFVTGEEVMPFGPIPKWASCQLSLDNQFKCVRVICEEVPDATKLWELESIGITKEVMLPSEKEAVLLVKSQAVKTDSGYSVKLPFKDDMRSSVNYRTARGQLRHLAQKVENDEEFYDQYNEIVEGYLERDFTEEVSSEDIFGHYIPHHRVYKQSATTPLRIVFNASSKPKGGLSLNDCLLTGPSLTTKLHDKYAFTADISKVFHCVLIDESDREYFKFLSFNKDQTEVLTFQIKVVHFGASCSSYFYRLSCKHIFPQTFWVTYSLLKFTLITT